MTDKDATSPFHLVVVAAGQGTRTGEDMPKQYIKIGYKSLLRHTLDRALSWGGLQNVRVVIHPDHEEYYNATTEGLDIEAPIHGGETRQESVYNALKSLDLKEDDLILIHDAARPFAKSEDVDALLEIFQKDGIKAATLAAPIRDSLRNDDGDVVERDGLWAIQTPQAFHFGILKEAHEKARAGHTDDTSLVSDLGIDIALVEGSQLNFKITTQDDIAMAKALIEQNAQIRTGIGFDVHAFEDRSGVKNLKLCGVVVEHALALKGHSDADVGLHAVTDAILGAIGKGDIGLHFPPSDEQFKDMDSAIFLEKAVEMMHEAGGAIQNLDITLICEAPKITTYREAMAERIAGLCGIEPELVNVKGTTTEKLGFTGRGEGVAAQAIATLRVVK